MTFTKQHFESIAHVLDANHADLAIVLDMANMLEETSPLFNRALFIKASTMEIREDADRLKRMLDRATGTG